MFEKIIDTVQNGKKTVVNALVSQVEVKKCFNAYIDSETNFAKALVQVSQNYTSKYFENFKVPSFFNPKN
jgi:hypothetical protein